MPVSIEMANVFPIENLSIFLADCPLSCGLVDPSHRNSEYDKSY